MSMERSRRDRFATHTVPLTWEIPAAVIGAVLFLTLLTPLVVQGVVSWAVAGQFAWPTNHLETALLGLAHGQFGDGLATDLASQLPSAALMWALTVVGEVVVLGTALVVGVRLRDLVGGSNPRRGLATPVQAAEALGLPRLRTSAPVVRPDLHARRPRRRGSGSDQRGSR